MNCISNTIALVCLLIQLCQASPWQHWRWNQNNNNNWNWAWNHHSQWDNSNRRPQTQMNQNNHNFQTQQACKMLMTQCQTEGNLVNRLNPTLGGAPMMSLVSDLMTHFDTNGDGCIVGSEYDRVVMERGFSLSYARYQFVHNLNQGLGVDNNACPGGISINRLQQQGTTTDDMAIIRDRNAAFMVKFCDQQKTRYQTNCDCIQLPAVCKTNPFNTTPTCLNFNSRNIQTKGCPFTEPNPSTEDPLQEVKIRCANMDYTNTDPNLFNAICGLINQNS